MNTTPGTMMDQHRRGLAPNKRKDREFQKPSKFIKPSHHHRAAAPTETTIKPAPKNQLLAGYMAYEFLSKGTLFGQPWDQIRPEAKPVDEPSRVRQVERHERYVEVSGLLKTDSGVQIPGVFNPTQLTRVLQL
ncbi:uncharacterized protein LOC141687383 [Apium graveolens]|uniref:uncharacterized protein LOC141687383 n=1 Tax=Apium graveolens TaxID=4045 RepID=UPI003D7BB54F